MGVGGGGGVTAAALWSHTKLLEVARQLLVGRGLGFCVCLGGGSNQGGTWGGVPLWGWAQVPALWNPTKQLDETMHLHGGV